MPSSIIPCLRYRDASAAIDWLCRVIGFEKKMVVPGEAGAIMHAELKLGDGMIMLGSVAKPETEYSKVMTQPDEIGGKQTQTIYVVVADADAVYARAQAAGATIVLPLTDQSYGGRDFTFRDPEGHVWSVGTYDPWNM